jgi:uncharacterized protein (TIGR03435 family)
MKQTSIATLLSLSVSLLAQPTAPRPAFDTFEVATIKPVESSAKSPRYIIMQGPHRFVEKDYTLKLLIAAAYDLNSRTISGGPTWTETDHFDITAVTPGDVQPTHAEQMSMLRALLADRFQLTFHREPREFSIYSLELAHPNQKSGAKLRPSSAPADQAPSLLSMVYPQKVALPARNATMADFASLLQRAILDRPVVDHTGLAGRYDFDLEWAPDSSQVGGDVKPAPDESNSASFFTAVQEQLGLKLVATKGPISALVIDRAEPPSAN